MTWTMDYERVNVKIKGQDTDTNPNAQNMLVIYTENSLEIDTGML
jgi:hypothetical protein